MGVSMISNLSKFIFALVIFSALVELGAGADTKSAHPNIVVVLIDDLGWGDFSCFGNTEVATTNIDRMAAEGVRFEQFYVNAPICSASRTALSTGQYPQRWRITSYLANRKLNDERGMGQWLDPAAPMLARMLHEAGYATGHFGKWHLGGQRDVGDAPLITRYGFDESLTNFEGLGPRVLPLLDEFDGTPPKKHALGSDQLGHGPVTWKRRDTVTAAYVDAVLQFISQAESNKRPFYINMWPDDVHTPLFPPEDRRGKGSKRARYRGVLKTLDEQLGRLFERIREDDSLRDNTIMVLCSDNGPEGGAGSAGPFLGGKGTLYEGGIRSPLIVWGPGFINKEFAGKANTTSVLAAMDLAPSLLEIAGVTKPDGVVFDGEPIVDVLLGRSNISRSGPLFFRRPPDRPGNKGEGNLPDLAVRDGRWKLLCEYDGSRPQLFNLDADRGEQNNVAAKNSDVVDRLTAAVLAWHKSMPPDRGAEFDSKE
jgi:arylsulfatase A-like enzyme